MIDKKYILNKKAQTRDEKKEEDLVADERRPLIPEGTYQVCFINIDEGVSHFKSLKKFLIFKIVDQGQYLGTELFMAMNLLDTKTGKPFKKVPRGSKYYQQWVIANNNRLPDRRDRMSSAIFKDGIFEAVVATVRPKFKDGDEQPDCFNYSKVDYIKKRLA